MAGADYSAGSSKDSPSARLANKVIRGVRRPSRRLVIDEVDSNPRFRRQNPFGPFGILSPIGVSHEDDSDSRDTFTKELKDMFSTLPPDELTEKLPRLMRHWINNCETVPTFRFRLQQTPDIAQKAIENSERVAALKDIIGEYLIPFVVRSFNQETCARLALIKLINGGYVSKLEAEIKICPTILALISTATPCYDIKVVSQLAPILGTDITERILLNRFLELCTSKCHLTRQSAAENIGYFCAAVSTPVFEKSLLPCYLALCQDERPIVRMRCAESVIYVSCVCPPELRRTLLTKTFINLLNDVAVVALTAFDSLGGFIVTFANPSLISIHYEDTTGDLVLVNQSKTQFISRFSRLTLSINICSMSDDDEFGDTIPYLRKKNDIDRTNDSTETDVNKLDSLSDGHGMFNNSFKVEQQKTVGLEELYSTMSLSDNFENDANKSVLSSFESDNVEQKGINIDIRNMTEHNAPQNVVPRELVESFISLSCEDSSDNENLNSVRLYVLPAILLTLGKESWLLFKETVHTLAEHGCDEHRLIIASSLHELAAILGPKMADDLVFPFEILFSHIYTPSLMNMLRCQDVLVDNLARFFEFISPKERLYLLPKVFEVINRNMKVGKTAFLWKIKEQFLRQLSLMVKFFTPTKIVRHIGPYVQFFMSDPMAFLRTAAVKSVSSVVKNIVVDRRLTSTFLISIAERYAHSKTWRFRHTFALLCSVLLKEQAMGSEDFASILWPHLLDLSWDPIPNVRILVAKCIVENLVIDEYFIQEHLESLKSVLRRLQADNDGDVRFSASCSSV
ncbi:serine/threonine-protein phosphatase 4 regulatory subunit 1-like isoform X2 [Sitophilus oryzae]|uniref:Serine/threonine-protein phosphatase 4 regulatory subunit 1-like isoform X2 n=1 Tax=Sitophilus oryzae TaxID=7048 RepID=A0A6J2XTE3_SITOR|nr:serine/threonine-protein phosphatase 4 regulatory subunit 1-like isoform X2 [Sitophilus oryzae]